jgi:hypothetical protein
MGDFTKKMDIVKGKWGFHWNNWNARGINTVK